MPKKEIRLANFPSPRIWATYRNAVSEFIAVHDLQTADDLYTVTLARCSPGARPSSNKEPPPPRTVTNRLSALSHNQVRALLYAPTTAPGRPWPRFDRDYARLQALRDNALMSVFFYTGCRVSEPASLRVRDFRQDQGYQVLDFTVKGSTRNRVAIHLECGVRLAE